MSSIIIEKVEIDSCEDVKFRKRVYLSNGFVGKRIELLDHDTNYIIMKNANVVNIATGKILKPFVNAMCTYLCVNIQLPHTKGYKTVLLHRLLAMAYIENPENKPIINHKNGDKLDISLSNLEWVTYSENNKHAFDTGLKKPTHIKSENCNLTKHSIDDVVKVCELLQSGMSPKSISDKYENFGYDFVEKILRRRTWKHISIKYKFPKVRRYSRIFSPQEIDKMYKYFSEGCSVKETIDKMGWEYNEKIRGNVKYFKLKYKSESSK